MDPRARCARRRAAVKFVLSGTGAEVVMGFAATSTFVYYLDHFIPRAGLTVGTIVDAGEVIGTTNATLDLGAFDLSQPLAGFASPSRYPDSTRYAVSPWKYFVEPLRSELYAKIYRAPGVADRDGRIDFDIVGRLVGAWYDVRADDDGSGRAGELGEGARVCVRLLRSVARAHFDRRHHCVGGRVGDRA